MATYTLPCTVEHVERLGTSMYGNPYYRVYMTTKDGDALTLRTQIDSSINYAIGNPEYRNELHVFKVTEAFRIFGAHNA